MRHIFIINPVAGKKDISQSIQKQIEKICTQKEIQPLIFISEYPGYERDMTKKMCTLFPNEKIRLYSIGGSGTLYHILSGIQNFELTEVACYPSGLTNDLLKCFTGNISHFTSLENLIDGKIQLLDYILMDDVAIPNFVSFGLGTAYFKNKFFMKTLSVISPQFSYLLSILKEVFRNRIAEYKINIDGQDYSGCYPLVVCMNGFCMGGNIIPCHTARPHDGTLNFVFVEKMSRLMQIRVLYCMKTGRIEKLGNKLRIVTGKQMKIRRKDKQPLLFNCDGEPALNKHAITTIEIIPAKLRFVTPVNAEIRSL